MSDMGNADGDEDDEDKGGGLDLARIKQIATFFYRAPRRHPALAGLTFVSVVLVTVFLAVFLPRTYTAEIHVIAKQDLVLPALGNPHRAIPTQAEDPLKGVAAELTKRDNLVAVIERTHLVERWDATRTPASRLKDKLLRRFTGPLSDADKMDALVGMLGKRLTVNVAPDDVMILVEWTDRQVPFELVNAVYENFVAKRTAENVGEVTDAISILETYAQAAHDKVDAALADLTKLEQARKSAASPATAPSAAAPRPSLANDPRPVPSAAPSVDPEALKALEEVRQQMRAVAEERRRKLADTASQLADAQASLGPMHPTVIALKQKMEAGQAPSAELQELRSQESSLLLRVASGGTSAPRPYRSPGPSRFDTAAPPDPSTSPLDERERRDDAPTSYARAALISAAGDYDNLRDRIDTAQIELDIQRAAAKRMYTISHPAELPKKPKKPNVPVVILGGLVAAIVLAFVSAGARDLASGRFIEDWQVEYSLGLPVLGKLPG